VATLDALGAARGREDHGARGPQDLDRRRADAAGPAVHEHGATGVVGGREAGDAHEVGPQGGHRLGQPGGIDERDAVGDSEHAVRPGEGVGGVAAAVEQGTDLVADLPPSHALTERDHPPGGLQARVVGRAVRRRVVSLQLEQVCPVDARGRDLDEDLARAGIRGGELGVLEGAVRGDHHRAHDCERTWATMVPARSRPGTEG
jgi:hypothetical protein